jgi:hypothetical protein
MIYILQIFVIPEMMIHALNLNASNFINCEMCVSTSNALIRMRSWNSLRCEWNIRGVIFTFEQNIMLTHDKDWNEGITICGNTCDESRNNRWYGMTDKTELWIEKRKEKICWWLKLSIEWNLLNEWNFGDCRVVQCQAKVRCNYRRNLVLVKAMAGVMKAECVFDHLWWIWMENVQVRIDELLGSDSWLKSGQIRVMHVRLNLWGRDLMSP